jgi:hypothetical protein
MRQQNLKLASKLYPAKPKIDTVKNTDSFNRNLQVLEDSFRAWSGLDEFRRNAFRNERYTFSDQWGDKEDHNDGKGSITERQRIIQKGNVPLQNNRIRGIVRSVLGVFSGQQTEPVCVSRNRDDQSKGETMSAAIQYVYQENKLWELDRRALEYFLITGVSIFRSTYGWRDGKYDVWTYLPNYNDIFFDNHMKDPRHWDCHLIGEISDMGLYDVMAQFADGSKEKAEEIRLLYANQNSERQVSWIENLTRDRTQNRNFFIPEDETQCRVISTWRKESKARLQVHDRLTGEYYKAELTDELVLKTENAIRLKEQTQQGITPENMKLIEYKWFVDNYWYYYFQTPTGEVLKEGETPYWHDSHPYSLKIYPFYNGRVYPFVGDFIDQQRYINRIITMQDFISKASAKGVLMMPVGSKPDNISEDDYADQWAQYDSVMYYVPKPGVDAPKQVITNSSQTGLYDMLNVQLKMLEDVSGVQGSLQGQAPSAGTPASLFMQQTQNSQTSLTDMFESFRDLRETRDLKNLKLVQQSWEDTRYINLVGQDAKNVVYTPDEVRNAEFDLSIAESTATPAYRMIMNDFLMQIFNAGQISIEELLKTGAFPFADKLLQSIESNKQAAAQQQPMGQVVPPDVQQQIQAGQQAQQTPQQAQPVGSQAQPGVQQLRTEQQ